jgi:peptidoglycan-N-acetylglucosamine deacetylase
VDRHSFFGVSIVPEWRQRGQTFRMGCAPCENSRVNPWLIGAPAAIAAAAGLTAYGAAYPRAELFGRTICRTNSAHKLAITFDDGPNPAITPKLLDLLDRHHARATFFLIGRFARECPGLVREVAARGHVAGNHTETHPNLFWLRPSEIQVELRLGHAAIANILGAPPRWFRPPWGLRNPWLAAAARELDMRVVLWTLLPGDWRAPTDEWLMERMLPIASHAERHAKNAAGTGDVLCLHDGSHRKQNADRTHTFAALEYWLPRWRDLGLEFVTIEDAVRTPAS